MFDEKNTPLVKTYNVNEKAGNQKYNLTDSLYCAKLKSYVYPRKYDPEGKIYQCRQKGNETEHSLTEAEISKQIFLLVNVSSLEAGN